MPLVIPELVYVVALFFAILGYLAARGLLQAWTHTLGYLLQWLGNAADLHISTHGIGFTVPMGAVFRRADGYVIEAIQNWVRGCEIQMAYCLHGLHKMVLYTGQAIDFLARETTATFEWLVHTHIPRWLKYAAVPLLLPLLIPKLIAALLPHLGARVVHTVKVIEHDVVTRTTHIVRTAVGGAVALPGWVIHIPARLRGLERADNGLSKRLHKVEGLLGAAVFAAALANVLGVSSRCVRSGNVGRVARALCGIPADLIAGLLAGLVVLEGGFSVVEFAKGMQAVEDELIKGLTATITELQGL